MSPDSQSLSFSHDSPPILRGSGGKSLPLGVPSQSLGNMASGLLGLLCHFITIPSPVTAFSTAFWFLESPLLQRRSATSKALMVLARAQGLIGCPSRHRRDRCLDCGCSWLCSSGSGSF